MSWQESTLGSECELYQPKTLAKNELDESGLYKVYGANGVIGTHSKFNHETVHEVHCTLEILQEKYNSLSQGPYGKYNAVFH